MTAKQLTPVLLAAVAAVAAACRGGESGAGVPLPEAYPRIQLYDADYAPAPGLPEVEVNVNARTVVRSGEFPALDIVYPRYNATVYLTVIPGLADVSRFDAVWEERRRRIDNNLGGAGAVAEEITSQTDSTYRSALVLSPSATQTPVQLLAASRERGTVVTATAFLHTPVTSADLDSIAPVIGALAADLRHIALTLR